MSESHGETNYVKIWGILLALLMVSIVGPMFGIKIVMLITAFGIALVKAGMVVRYFMHIGIEKKYISYMLLLGLAFMVLLFVGIAPDIMKKGGQNWENTAVVRLPPPVGHHADDAGASDATHGHESHGPNKGHDEHHSE